MQKSILYTSLPNQISQIGAQTMNQNVHQSLSSQVSTASAINAGAQQPVNAPPVHPRQPQQVATVNATCIATSPNESPASNADTSISSNTTEHEEAFVPNFIAPNGCMDWDAAAHWSICKYESEHKDDTHIKRPVIPLVEQAQKRLLPTSLSIEVHKLIKQTFAITNRSKQNAAHKACVERIMNYALNMLDLSVEVEKRQGNTKPLYELDKIHEATRRLWFNLYELSFFGDSKGGRNYKAYRGIMDYARINENMDAIGRIIGFLKKEYSSPIDNKRNSVVTSKSFYR